MTWGDDKTPLDREVELRRKTNPFHMVDLGWMYRSNFGVKENVGLETALNSFGLEFEGRPHDAMHDARNTCRVHMAMIERMRQSPIFLNRSNATQPVA